MDHDIVLLTDRAQSLLQANDLGGACAAFEKLAQHLPDDPHIWFTLGSLQGKLGDMDAAADSFGRVTQLTPEQPDAWHNMGMALHSLGKLDDTEQAYRRAIELQPDRTDFLLNLAWLKGQQKNYAMAEELYQRVLQAAPAHPAGLFGIGAARMQQGRLNDALEFFQQTLKVDPQHLNARMETGVVLHKQGNLEQAARQFKELLSSHPESPVLHFNLGSVLNDMGEYIGANDHLQQALRLRPDYPAARVILGRVLQTRGRSDLAIENFRTAIASKPDCIEAYTNLGMTLLGQGKYDAAIETFRQGQMLDSENIDITAGEALVHEHRGDVATALALLEPLLAQGSRNIAVATTYALLSKKLGTTDRAIAMLEALLPGKEHSPARRGEIYLSLGKLYQDNKDYDRAFECFVTGNKLVPYRFSRDEHKKLTDRIIASFNSRAMQQLPRASNMNERPVFIVAMPRSGTTLIEQILDAHPAMHGAGELSYVDAIGANMPGRIAGAGDYPECIRAITPELINEFSAQYLNGIAELAPADALRVVDKMPHNFMDLGLIELLFPTARVIHISRNPLDTCVSIFTQHFSAGHGYATDIGDLGFYYREYLRLMEHWRSVLTLPVLNIRYENIVEDPEREIRRLVAFCGMAWSDDCLQFYKSSRDVATPSYDQVRQPIYSSSIGRWKYYEDHLGPLRDELGM